MAGRTQTRAKKGQAATPAPVADTDTSEPAGGSPVAATEEPSGDAVAAGDAVKASTPGPDVPGQGGVLPDAAHPAVRVEAHVTRRRAGRAWSRGDVVGFAPGELGADQIRQLEADPGFSVTLAAEEA